MTKLPLYCFSGIELVFNPLCCDWYYHTQCSAVTVHQKGLLCHFQYYSWAPVVIERNAQYLQCTILQNFNKPSAIASRALPRWQKYEVLLRNHPTIYPCNTCYFLGTHLSGCSPMFQAHHFDIHYLFSRGFHRLRPRSFRDHERWQGGRRRGTYQAILDCCPSTQNNIPIPYSIHLGEKIMSKVIQKSEFYNLTCINVCQYCK